MSLLQTVDMGVAFGGLKAVNEVSIDVKPGTLVGLIGPMVLVKRRLLMESPDLFRPPVT